jgi:hypothetical protein
VQTIFKTQAVVIQSFVSFFAVLQKETAVLCSKILTRYLCTFLAKKKCESDSQNWLKWFLFKYGLHLTKL